MNKIFHMIDVGSKPVTHRIAVAEGFIDIGSKAFEHITHNTLPKGDALTLCEIAGIQGAKNASNLMVLCHPLGLDKVQIVTELFEDTKSIQVSCIVSAHAKTGVEMEALAGVNAALLNLWDVIKMIEPELNIRQVRLLAKRGGKSGLWLHSHGVPEWVNILMKPPVPQVLNDRRAVVVTLSDRAHQGLYVDRSGPLLANILTGHGAELSETLVLPDEPETLRETLLSAISAHDPHLLITTGGTGVAPRDTTPETLLPLFDRPIDGIGELIRSDGSRYTTLSWASRAVAGLIGKTIVISLPGNPKAVTESMSALLPELLPHLIRIARGDNL